MTPKRFSVGKKLVRGTQATYTKGNEWICDLEKLAKDYSSICNIPEKLGFNRAAEIALLSRSFLTLFKQSKLHGGKKS